jgi:eukaryotic-like serine/threonine-protein kinase
VVTPSGIKKVSVETGAVSTISTKPGFFRGATWSGDGNSIVFASGSYRLRLFEVSSRGGVPRLLLDPDKSEETQSFSTPSFVPSDAHQLLLFSLGITAPTVTLLDLRSGSRTAITSGIWPVYSQTGHIIYQNSLYGRGLWAVPVSTHNWQRIGEPFQIAENGSYPTLSGDGTLVYLEEFPRNRVLTWVNRAGAVLEETGQPQAEIAVPSLSPDGRLIGVEGVEGNTGADVWIHSATGSAKIRVTVHAARDSRAIWSPDGSEIAFWSDRNGSPEVFITSAVPGSTARPVLIGGLPLRGLPEDWSSDGKYLVYKPLGTTGMCYAERDGRSAWRAAVCAPPEPSVLEMAGRLSPDSRFLAYCSNQSGRPEIYVRPFPNANTKWQISREGGTQPRWRKDGKELFYVQRDTMIAVPVSTAPEFSTRTAARLFSSPALEWEWLLPIYDVSPDGRRFVLVEPKGPLRRPAIRVVQNWFAEFGHRR